MATEDEQQHFCLVCAFMMLCCHAQGQEYECEVEFTGKCIYKIRWKIPEKYAQRETPFTVSYMSSEGKTENAVLLHYVGRYYCEAAGGHVCDDGDNSTSIIRNSATACVTDRMYILAADGEDDVFCMPTQNERGTSGSHPDTRKQSNTNDTFHNKGSFIAVTAGIVCAIVMLLLILIAVVWFQIRRGRWKFIKQIKVPLDDPEEQDTTENTRSLKRQGG